MSESHDKYKIYIKQKERKNKAEKRGSNYVSDYVKDEQIAKSEYLESRRDEEDNRRNEDRLFGNIY